ALEAHPDFERVGKTRAFLDAQELRVVFAERIVGIEREARLVADALALQGFLDLREDAAVAVQVGHLGAGLVQGHAVAVLELVREGDDGAAIDLHCLARSSWRGRCAGSCRPSAPLRRAPWDSRRA